MLGASKLTECTGHFSHHDFCSNVPWEYLTDTVTAPHHFLFAMPIFLWVFKASYMVEMSNKELPAWTSFSNIIFFFSPPPITWLGLNSSSIHGCFISVVNRITGKDITTAKKMPRAVTVHRTRFLVIAKHERKTCAILPKESLINFVKREFRVLVLPTRILAYDSKRSTAFSANFRTRLSTFLRASPFLSNTTFRKPSWASEVKIRYLTKHVGVYAKVSLGYCPVLKMKSTAITYPDC